MAFYALLPFGRKAKLFSHIANSVLRLRRHPEDGVLNGNLMSKLLNSALLGMEKVEDTLVRPDESLDLFTTTTNVYGYDTAVPTGAGGASHTDRSFRQLLHFHYDVPAGPSSTCRMAGCQGHFSPDGIHAAGIADRAEPPSPTSSAADCLRA